MSEGVSSVERARDAVRRESWPEAYELLHDADPSELEPGDLEGLADAAWWMSKGDESIAVRQRAYAGFAAAGEEPRAAYNAARLAVEHFQRGEPSVGAGWLMRSRRHLADRPESAEHGFLAVIEATVARYGGDLDRAMPLAERAADLGRRFADPDVWALAIHTQGLIHIAAGRPEAGLPLLDEAMTSVVAGELSSFFTGVVYCNVIEACLELADVGRAGEWSEAARAWCESIPPESPYPGLCRISRAEVANLRGAWADAEAEARRASEELLTFDPIAAAQAVYETGEIRRRMGDAGGAEERFDRARELGFEPQPGLALLRLHQGKGEAALAALRVAASAGPGSRLRRARLLFALVDVAVAVEDPETARHAVSELESLAASSPIGALEAIAATARGTLALIEGDVSTALERLRTASNRWQQLGLPYETAGARIRYGRALRAAGDDEEGTTQLRAALSIFERLGAPWDADEARRLIDGGVRLPKGLTPREAEVLRLVAAGKTNREIAGQLVISEHTVARHLQNMFAKLGVSSRAAATAFAFEHGIA